MANTIEQIQHELKRAALFALEYAGLNFQTWGKIKRLMVTWGFNKQKQIEFIQDFSTWLNDNCSPVQACRAIAEAGAGDGALRQEVNAANSIHDALKRGKPISEGMAEWFDAEMVALFDAGQQAGADALTRVLKDYLKQEAEIKRAKAAFWQPVRPALYP